MICHYALDSECHPYIEKIIHKSGISHNEIEMEFDRMFMVEDKINPIKHLSTRHIHPTFKNAKIIIYERAILVAVSLILEYQNRLDNQKELSERFNKSFGAGDEWEKLQL